jgi:hypothetical protein
VVVPTVVPSSSEPADKAQSSAAVSLLNINQAPFQPLQEDSNHTDTTKDAATNHSRAASNGEVMLATMTDVQQAIEQLGHKDDFDGSRSFTFSSSRDESTDHETDHDIDADAGGEGWHKSARQKLAEKAKKVVAARDAADGRVPMRSSAPPIDVELSDDSEDEGDGPSPETSPNGHRSRHHPHIPEEEEGDTTAPRSQVDHKVSYSPSIQPSERFIVPSPVSTAPRPASELTEDMATEPGIRTATQPSFPQNERGRTPENNSSLPSPVSPGRRGISNGISTAVNDAAIQPSSAQLVFPSKSQTLSLQEIAGVLPSPAASSNGHRHGYSMSSATSSGRFATSSPLPTLRSTDVSANKKSRNVHPAEWTVEEVVDWLRSKGFDDSVCDQFIEQEITGDVLLELDVSVLKSEIGIVAYGKRLRIANAITELRRPPSVLSSSAEQHTRPGSLSHGSPLTQQGMTVGSAGLGSLVSSESPPDSGDMIGRPYAHARGDSDPGVLSKASDSNATVGLGLGIPPSLLAGGVHVRAVVRVLFLHIVNRMVALMVFRMQKGRPPHLSLSPSDPALAATARSAPVEQRQNAEEDRGVFSDVGYCLALSFSEANEIFSERNQKLCENGPRTSVWPS